jgi:solute carrier family 44 (choline transporter-like protein), member 2/4/5
MLQIEMLEPWNRYMEKVMKFINRNAYIIIAVKGYSFCGGAARAIKLIVLNVGRLAAVNVIGDALMFLGKLTIVMACGALAFLMTDLPMFSKVDSKNYITSPIVPVILTLFAAYMVASVFFSVRPLRNVTQMVNSQGPCGCQKRSYTSWAVGLRDGCGHNLAIFL